MNSFLEDELMNSMEETNNKKSKKKKKRSKIKEENVDNYMNEPSFSKQPKSNQNENNMKDQMNDKNNNSDYEKNNTMIKNDINTKNKNKKNKKKKSNFNNLYDNNMNSILNIKEKSKKIIEQNSKYDGSSIYDKSDNSSNINDISDDADDNSRNSNIESKTSLSKNNYLNFQISKYIEPNSNINDTSLYNRNNKISDRNIDSSSDSYEEININEMDNNNNDNLKNKKEIINEINSNTLEIECIYELSLKYKLKKTEKLFYINYFPYYNNNDYNNTENDNNNLFSKPYSSEEICQMYKNETLDKFRTYIKLLDFFKWKNKEDFEYEHINELMKKGWSDNVEISEIFNTLTPQLKEFQTKSNKIFQKKEEKYINKNNKNFDLVEELKRNYKKRTK